MTSAETQPENRMTPCAQRLRGLSPYEPPAPSPFVDLVLDANEGAPPTETILEVLRSISPEDLRRYPDARALEERIAPEWSIEPERVVVTNGADDAIDRLCRAVLEPGRELVLHTPTFEMIERSARLAGASVRPVEWSGGPFHVPEFVGALSSSTSLIAIVSPNNPTGGALDVGEIHEIIREARSVGAIVMLDFAYIEFADHDPTRELLDEPNLVILRTFSKAMGLAGARVGYAIAPAAVARWLRTAGGPYPVSAMSIALAGQALDTQSNRSRYIASVRAERDALTAEMRRLNCEVLDSQGNFVMAKFPDAAFVQRALQSLGISVRAFPSRPALSDSLRITLPGDEPLFDCLRTALLTILNPQAILFDLDGVIADVSASYRAAIIETARSYDVEVTPANIAEAKSAGDANNDWELTKRIIEQNGISCELPDVISRFQSIYLGGSGRPGLRESERLIPDRSLLLRLRDRFVLGVVTGRPRAEAEWFLERYEVRDLFETLVCMEDAAPKPSPDPVQRAMSDLAIDRAWMIGDTPDDILAARLCRVLPIGIPAPEDDDSMGTEAMNRAGAATIIAKLDELEELMS